MLPKAAAIDAALASGVRRVHVISYKMPDSLLLEVFTNEGTGTLVVNDINALTPAEQAAAKQSHEPALGQRPAARRSACLRYTAGEDHVLDARLVPTTCAPRSPTREMLAAQGLLAPADFDGHPRRARGARRGPCARRMGDRARRRGRPHGAGAAAHRRGSARPAGACTSAARATTRCWRRCGCTCATPPRHSRTARRASRRARGARRASRATSRSPATRTCSRPCRQLGRALGGGFAAEFATMPTGLARARCAASTAIRSARAAGYGTPGLPLDREATRAGAGLRAKCRNRSPRCSCRAARPRAQLLFEITLLLQDLGRLAPDLLLFYTQEFAFVALADEMTTGSSIMPQKRNPDVLELLRGRRCDRAGLPRRSAGDHGEAALRLPARPATPQAAAIPRHRPRDRQRGHHAVCARGVRSAPSPSGWTRVCTPPRKRIGWSSRKDCRFARPTGPWPAGSAASPAAPRAGNPRERFVV